MDGYLIVDGHLIRIDQEGRVIYPEFKMSKDVPSGSIFDMSNKNKDPQLTNMN